MFSRKIITSTGFYRYCAPDASAPVVAINESPSDMPQNLSKPDLVFGKWKGKSPRNDLPTPLSS